MRFDATKKIFEEKNVFPDKLAFAGSNGDITWRELESLSDSICERLKNTKIPPGHPVLLYGNKEIFLLAALVSCYRLGLPFIPVHPEFPHQRIKKIIRQSGSKVVIASTDTGNLPDIPVIITETSSGGADSFEKRYPGTAYILFTSGSSGDPKGVLIAEKSLTAFLSWFSTHFPIDNETIFINQAELSFDISLADLFGALQAGGTAVFNSPAQYANDQLFFSRINKYRGNYWNSTPSFILKCLASKNFNSQSLPALKYFVLSGENLSSALVKELMCRFPGASVINAYGPTEATIFSSFVRVSSDLLAGDSLPVSDENAENIFLDQDELILLGPQVGQGYLDQAALTKEKFFAHDGRPAFRTGDRMFRKNGFLYFAGRKDGQIKLNGYRIETGEVKRTLEKIQGIEEAECIPVEIEGRVKRLVAFVRSTGRIHANELKNLLEKELPAYMIPSEIILLHEFPRTSSFKTDRKKLLEDYLQG